MENENKQIEVNEKRVHVKLNNKSDLCLLFCIIKNLINRIDLIPISIYTTDKNTKYKKSLNKFKSINFWEFLDYKEEKEETLFIQSGETIEQKIDGWEIRFKIAPSMEEINKIYEKSLEDREVIIDKLKIEKNE